VYRLHARFVRAYTHTLRLHMMCTPFLVYTYAFAYDVHDIFSVHLCHTDILLCDDCTFSPLFSNFSDVYTNSIHTLGVLQHYNSWYTTYIGTMLPGWWTYQRILITSHLDPWEISLFTYHKDGNQGYRCFITFNIACLCHDCDWNYMLCTVNNLFWNSHRLYQTYTLENTLSQLVYKLYTQGFPLH